MTHNFIHYNTRSLPNPFGSRLTLVAALVEREDGKVKVYTGASEMPEFPLDDIGAVQAEHWRICMGKWVTANGNAVRYAEATTHFPALTEEGYDHG